MWGKQLVMITAFALGILLTGSLCAIAAPPVFYGIFVSYKGDTLTVMDKQGHKEQYRVLKATLIANSEGTNPRLERVQAGTRVSVTAHDGAAVQIIIKEVPK